MIFIQKYFKKLLDKVRKFKTKLRGKKNLTKPNYRKPNFRKPNLKKNALNIMAQKKDHINTLENLISKTKE